MKRIFKTKEFWIGTSFGVVFLFCLFVIFGLILAVCGVI